MNGTEQIVLGSRSTVNDKFMALKKNCRQEKAAVRFNLLSSADQGN